MSESRLPYEIAYGHSRSDALEHEWEHLIDHLRNTATCAREFADAFGAGEWGELAGLWHDVGKYLPAFQDKLRGEKIQVEHAGAGAALAASLGGAGRPLAFVIAGHHGGLANNEVQDDTPQRSLAKRLEENGAVLDFIRPLLPPEITDRALPPLPAFRAQRARTREEGRDQALRSEMWIRFLFSALVDADSLATEAFYQPGKRDGFAYDSIATLRERLDAKLASFSAEGTVNERRAEVLAECRAAADRDPGLFSLQVPTGGGKTLSSLAFALRHAEKHKLRRVIVAIPYTSIIEQTAAVYRGILGAHNVLEHHSAVDEASRREEDSERELRRRLAAENWDAPVVVTTNVQLFESMFSNLRGRCRKLHNLAKSVVVLDEAQALPLEFLSCALDAIRELARTFGSSVVLCTATQPALEKRDALPNGLAGVHPIIREPDALSRTLERVRVHWPASDEATPYSEIARQVAGHEQVLVIVHQRKDARLLAEMLPREDLYHLSALMAPAHRSAVLAKVKAALDEGRPCRLVATQLIEAGVDVDFPVVFRAMAGLDSLAQAAGRCNREGNLDRGDLYVFIAETPPPPGLLRNALEAGQVLLKQHGPSLSLTDAKTIKTYFETLMSLQPEKDKHGVQTSREKLNFASVGQKVRLIEDDFRIAVVVPWGEGEARMAAARANPGRETLRALQPYIVQVSRFSPLMKRQGVLTPFNEDLFTLDARFRHLYDEVFGLRDGDIDEATSA